MMRRITAALLSLILLVTPVISTADGLAEYRDSVYSFNYPSTWKKGNAADGTIILEVPGTDEGVLTYGLRTDLMAFTGDEEADKPLVQSVISQYSQPSDSSLLLSGEYETVRLENLTGFRAFGKWGGTRDAEIVYLTGNGCMILFFFVGQTALGQEQAILTSVRVFADDSTQDTSKEAGYKRWTGAGFSVDYPETYGTMDISGSVVFARQQDGAVTDMLMVRTYAINMGYSDSQAPLLAATFLPKSTHVEAEPVMERVGPWNTAVIRGNTDSGPMAFYILGAGQTAMALMFMGEEICGMAETIVASARIGE